MQKLIDMRFLLSFLISLYALTVHSQSVTIKGFAPHYIGKEIFAYTIDDYLSSTERLLATTVVKSDSTFQLSFSSQQTQKVVIKSQNNHGFLLSQPNGDYSIYFPERDKYTPYRPNGNEVELAFLKLDSTDINYKILGFQRWVDHFIGNNFHLKSIDAVQFNTNLDKFKTNVEKAYIEDTSTFFKAYVRFTLAGLDNIPNAGERNRYEKYDFYIKGTPVYYNNEAYMTYISDFYQKFMPRLSNETNQAVYEGILRASPTLIMHALNTEYTMSNVQVRELVMIKMLAEGYNESEYPQTNILTILDSLTHRALFKEHRKISSNLINKLTELVPGGKAPAFVLIEEGKETKTNADFKGKYLYVHFMNPESVNSMKDLPLLKNLYSKYGEQIEFVSIYKDKELSTELIQQLSELPWGVYGVSSTNGIWKNYRVESFPLYTLIDQTGYIVASPALAPTPNGEYKTIDEIFFYIKKTLSQGR